MSDNNQSQVPARRLPPAAQTTIRRLRHQLRSVRARLQKLIDRRRAAPGPGHRPDGTIVAPSPAAHPQARPTGGPLSQVTRPFTGVFGALRDHWNDSVREARFAARDKEADMRADYERRVQHDSRLHAVQRNRKQD
jgi:hypothetical protein